MMHEINNREKRKVIYLTTVVINLFVKIVGFSVKRISFVKNVEICTIGLFFQ